MRKLICLLLSVIAVVFFVNLSLAAEHPGEHPGAPAEAVHKEHPGKTHAEEHPGAEHPGEGPMASAAEIIKGIKDHIASVTEANNGYYPLRDEEEGKDLMLKLVKIHEDKVSHIKKEDACFACTDFVTADGIAAYDVDFWMRKNKEGKLEVYQTKVHKKDGTPRFTYKDDEIVPVE